MSYRSLFLKKVAAAACSVLIASASLPAMCVISSAGAVIGAGAESTVISRNTLKGATLTLTGEIGINFYLDIQDTESFDSVILKGPNGELTEAADKIACESSGLYAGLYKLTYPVDPSQIDESVSVCLMNGNETVQLYGADGTEYDSDCADLSVREYIESVQNDENAASDLSALANALDVYGRYSGVQFKDAADPELDAVLADITAEDLSKYKYEINGELPSGVSIVGASLLLDSKTSFRIYFDKDPVSASIDGNTAKITEKNGMYYIELPNIAAPDLDSKHQAVIGGCTIDFSALSYVYSVLSSEADSSKNIVKLVKALYAYSFAADMYFGASSGNEPSVTDAELVLTDNGDDTYTFAYGNDTFTALYTPYIGGDWKIYDSYKITNRADMVIICEKLLKLNKVRGRITQYRTAKDMADEWEVHNRGYAIALSLSMTDAAARLKDVDMDKKDQGKTFDDFIADYLKEKEG